MGPPEHQKKLNQTHHSGGGTIPNLEGIRC
jgi:hypothetical protein